MKYTYFCVDRQLRLCYHVWSSLRAPVLVSLSFQCRREMHGNEHVFQPLPDIYRPQDNNNTSVPSLGVYNAGGAEHRVNMLIVSGTKAEVSKFLYITGKKCRSYLQKISDTQLVLRST